MLYTGFEEDKRLIQVVPSARHVETVVGLQRKDI